MESRGLLNNHAEYKKYNPFKQASHISIDTGKQGRYSWEQKIKNHTILHKTIPTLNPPGGQVLYLHMALI